MIWGVWKERNARIFEEKGVCKEVTVQRVKEMVWNWLLTEPSIAKIRMEEVIFEWEKVILAS